LTEAAARSIMTAMEEAGSTPITWKQRLYSRETWLAVVLGGALGTAIAGAWWKIWVVPEQAIIHKRYQSTMDIARMYGLQLTYKRAHGTFANDFASLLTVEPDAAALKASLAANIDMTTLTVVGDEKRFKIELNVLDAERTPIRIRGPIVPKAPAAEPSALPAPAPPMNADGAPIGR
jgi:hypothetical protein